MSATGAYSDTVKPGRDGTLQGRVRSIYDRTTHEVWAMARKLTRGGEAPRTRNSGHPGAAGARRRSCYWTWVRGTALGANHKPEL